MEVFNSLNENKNKPLSLALGFFDGVHTAHREILETAVFNAKENGIKSACITFKKSPAGFFDPKKNITIQTLNDRLNLMEKTGLDYVYMLDFSLFKDLSAENYLKNVLIKNFNPKFIVTGFNHTFGSKNAEIKGDSTYLKENESLGYKYIEIEKRRKNNVLISSTNIKKFLSEGYIKEGNALLGYKFSVEGRVEKGLQLARKLGYKTANIKWPDGVINLPYGVYSGGVEYLGKKYDALINWGVKPTIGASAGALDASKTIREPVLEAHILNFDKEIYGENIRVYFNFGIREEKKFSSLDELKGAIKKDIDSVCNDFV